MTGCVYMLVSPTGLKYVGRTVNIKRRLSHYMAKSNADRSPVYREISRYGFENFEVKILEEISADSEEELNIKLNAAEKGYIELYDTVNHGLNRNRWDSNIRIIHTTPETRAKMSKARIGKKHSKESIEKRSGANAYQSKSVHSDKLGMTFCSLREAAHYAGITNGCKVSEVITGKRHSCGFHPVTGEKIDDWVYV